MSKLFRAAALQNVRIYGFTDQCLEITARELGLRYAFQVQCLDPQIFRHQKGINLLHQTTD